jgi:hypothetical protein
MKEGEGKNKHMRFLLFIAGVWLAIQLIKLIMQSLWRPPQPRQKRTYGVGGSPTQSPREEFKNVEDADFIDITESEKEKDKK